MRGPPAPEGWTLDNVSMVIRDSNGSLPNAQLRLSEQPLPDDLSVDLHLARTALTAPSEPSIALSQELPCAGASV